MGAAGRFAGRPRPHGAPTDVARNGQRCCRGQQPNGPAWTVEDLEARSTKAKRYSRYKTSTVRRGIESSKSTPGWPPPFSLSGLLLSQPACARPHPRRGRSPHRRVCRSLRENLSADAFYRMGDHIGRSGLERVYELELRGVKGRTPCWSMPATAFAIPPKPKMTHTCRIWEELTLTGPHLAAVCRAADAATRKAASWPLSLNLARSSPWCPRPGFDPDLLVGFQRGPYYKTLVC